MRALAGAILGATLAGCFVHTYSATFPSNTCQTSSTGDALLSASHTSCGESGAPAPTPAATP